MKEQCNCSTFDWTGHDMTAEHHPDCEISHAYKVIVRADMAEFFESLGRVIEMFKQMLDCVKSIKPFMPPRLTLEYELADRFINAGLKAQRRGLESGIRYMDVGLTYARLLDQAMMAHGHEPISELCWSRVCVWPRQAQRAGESEAK